MCPIRRCHVCGSHFRPSPDRRHGRIRVRRTVGSGMRLPDTAFVCDGCRPEVVELTRHWQPREPGTDACGFCDRPADETGVVALASIVDDRVVSQGTYPLCRGCEDVFATFLGDLHASVDLPASWTHTPSATAAVFDRTDDDLRVETTPPTDSDPRLRLLAGSDPIVEAVPRGPPRERAREFVAAFEAFYTDDGDDPRTLGAAVVDGHPGLRAAP
ncbi:hypothetical protein [Haloplanus aerogenes]|uniref:Uncharacterized protein n=2 Tax=Haloplanus aerogenes TaxID=660522 RepID=A0A3G8QT58_9EURY|nr:hypothetical protein [Haloplanus aerogenes]AZH24629.1 hypothetical protein DU502_04180 [Haloplanus aerogenes]